MHGLGRRKDMISQRLLRCAAIEADEGSVRYPRVANDAGLRRAVESSSARCRDVLAAAGSGGRFEARIDGIGADVVAGGGTELLGSG